MSEQRNLADVVDIIIAGLAERGYMIVKADEIASLRERVAEMQYEAGMYQSLYEVAKAKLESARKALELTQFGFNHRRCPVCAGFNVGPNGETDLVHTKKCPVGLALTDETGKS